MSGFGLEWLALREPADALARAEELAANLVPLGSEAVRVVDLAAGTGSNLRYLAPRLVVPQHWTLVDDDALLLAHAAARAAAEELPPWIVIDVRRLDLARELTPLESCDLVTTSAFFDLVSEAWLERLARTCAGAGVRTGLFALTFDGRIEWTPAEAGDAEVAALVLEHMRRDKGFGQALGAGAVPAVVAAFEAVGYVAREADSAWRLGDSEAPLQRALLDGYVAAALEQARDDGEGVRESIASWARRRAEHLERAESGLVVGHRDVLVRLADSR